MSAFNLRGLFSGFTTTSMLTHRSVRSRRSTGRPGRLPLLDPVQTLETRILPATITVTSLDDDVMQNGFVTLREAIQAANTNKAVDGSVAGSVGEDTIVFAPTLDTSAGLIASLAMSGEQFTISESVKIIGNGSLKTVIDASSSSRIFFVSSGSLTLEKLTLQNGNLGADSGPGDLRNAGAAVLLASSGTLTINDCRIQENTTAGAFSSGGAVAAVSGSITISSSLFRNNSTTGASSPGGAVFSGSGAVQINSSTFIQNSTGGDASGGGAVAVGTAGLTITDSLFNENSTQNTNSPGGAISTSAGGVVITSSRFRGNSTAAANSSGGAIFSQSGALLLDSTWLDENQTQADGSPGSAIATASAAVSLRRSTLADNFTAGTFSGGALATLSGTVIASQSTFSGNATLGTGSTGAAIHAEGGQITISQSTLTRNNAGRNAQAAISGGAIFATATSVNIENSIVADNQAPSTGTDIAFTAAAGKTLSVKSSLIGRSDGTTLVPTTGTTPDNQGNLIGGTTAAAAINPQLSALFQFGGPVPVHLPLASSPAIDRGSNALAVDRTKGNELLTTDQRSNVLMKRVVGGTVDMGAAELFTLAGPLVVTIATDEIDGNVAASDLSLREAVTLANGSAGTDTITFAAAINGSEIDLTLGQITLSDSVILTGNGATRTIVDAQLGSRLFDITESAATVSISGMTLKNGRTTGNGHLFSDDRFQGAGIRSQATGSLTIADSTLSGNTTGGSYSGGAAIAAQNGKLIITGSTLSGNTTNGGESDGGAIHVRLIDLQIADSTVTGNSTKGNWSYGGAIYAEGRVLSVTRSTISGNQTAGIGAVGGAVAFYDAAGTGKLLISRSTISGNSTTGRWSHGGGIYASFSNVILSQTTLSGNSVSGTEAEGGGLFVSGFSNETNTGTQTIISQSTVTLNKSVKSGGGGIRGGNELLIRNSIVAGNTDNAVASDVLPSQFGMQTAFSLIGRSEGTGLTPSAVPNTNGNLIGGTTAATALNPKLGPLQINGGLTMTHALQSGSSAIDRGSLALAVDETAVDKPALTNDQRGGRFMRILDGDHVGTPPAIVDMGAAEFAGIRLIFPAPNAFTLKPTFTWNAFAGAVKYQVQINNVTTGVARFREATVTGTSYTPSQEMALGEYNVWIRPVFAGDVPGNWSSTQTAFLLPAVTWTNMPRTQLVSKPTLTWNNLKGAVKYDLWGDNFSAGITQVFRLIVNGATGTTTSWTPPTDLAMGKHRFWIRGIDAKGNAGRWSILYEALVVTQVKPTGPALSTFDATPTFTWNAVPGAASYQFFLRNQATNTMVFDGLSVATNTFTPASDVPTGNYRWWVLAVSSAQAGSIRSGGAELRDLNIGGQPAITSPVAGTTTGTKPTITWQAVDGAVSYIVFMNRTSAPTGNVLNITGITTTSFTPSAAIAAGDYRLWLRAVDGTGKLSSWSTEVNFKIAAKDLAPAGNSIQLASIPENLLPSQLPADEAVTRKQPSRKPAAETEIAGISVQTDLTSQTNNPRPAHATTAPEPAGPAQLDTLLLDLVMEDWQIASVLLDSPNG
jgi:CSLREA domain-containing protein